MKPGVYKGLGRYAYDQIQAVNWSSLKHVLQSPAHARAAIEEREREVDRSAKQAFVDGDAIHACCLEPERWESDYIRPPSVYKGRVEVRGSRGAWHVVHLDGAHQDQVFTTKSDAQRDALAWRIEGVSNRAYRTRDEAKSAVAEAYSGKTFVTAERQELATGCRDSVLAHPIAGPALRSALKGKTTELTCVWRDEMTGLLCKARLDAVSDVRGEPCVWDLKSTRDARPESFCRDAGKFMYYGQFAYYAAAYEKACLQGGEKLPAYLRVGAVAVEKSKPYGVAVYFVGPKTWDAGDCLWKQALHAWSRCEKSGDWPSYTQNEPHVLDIPSYYYGRL